MHHPRRALALLALLGLLPMGGCVKLDSYSCAQSSECQSGDLLGTCEIGGMCSFPDAQCPSGKKYGELAGEQSGQCVGVVDDTTGTPTTSPTEPATTDPSSTTFDPDTSTTFDPTTMTSEVSATTTGATTSSSTTTGETDTTGEPPTCGEVGAACVDGACCGGCAFCDADDVCKPAPADQKPCGECSLCGADGECMFAPVDSPCPADCGDIVWQEVIGMAVAACYAYDAMPTTGACDGEGSCLLPDPVMAKCPEPDLDEATALAECELICKEEEEENPCIPGGPASAVDMDSYCYIQSASPACTTTCSDDKTFLNPATCVDGICVHMMADECGPYTCDPETLMCLETCKTSEDCAAMLFCIDGVCM